MFKPHKTLLQKYAHVKVPHPHKQPCPIALCAKVWGTSMFALAWMRKLRGGQTNRLSKKHSTETR